VDGKVAGFQSYFIQDEGRKALAQALRIDQKMKGLGLGKHFMNLCRENLLKVNSEIKEVKTVWYCAVDKSKRNAQLGEMMAEQAFDCFEIPSLEIFVNRFDYINDGELERMTKSGLACVYKRNPKAFVNRFLQSNYLKVNWVGDILEKNTAKFF